ncbi:MAG: hypothetical protein JWP63_4259 [Candidatus Solibacter sp.]|nr:hypothetical protein [Candidatus Solibacter sp.]
MHRFTLVALFAAVAFAQNLFAQGSDPFHPKPPAEVDQALRARIQEFFDLHVKGQYRKAEEMVAEDTRDFFYTQNKPKYLSCEITKIEYSDNFTKASSVVTCERYIMMPGFSDHPMKVPGTNTWKIENGKWMWYVDQDSLLNTPFGRMKAGDFPKNGPAPAPPSLSNIPTTGDFLMNQVKMEPQSVELKEGESAKVTITSAAPGSVDLVVNGKLGSVEAKLDDAKVKSMGKAILTVHAGKGAKSGTLNVEVVQTTQTLPLQVKIVE